jgi:hypothetical protein
MEEELQSCRLSSLPVVASPLTESDTHEGDAAGSDGHAARGLTLDVDAFAWKALEGESAQQGVSVEELVSFSILYYLADSDSGRIARRLPLPKATGEVERLLVNASQERRK